MGKVKAVLDTNVLVAMLFKKTLAREFSEVMERGDVEFYCSEGILNELARVLAYPKIEAIFEKSGVDKRGALESLLEKLKVARPKTKINLIKEDSADNKFLECAVEAKATYVVSGDRHLLGLKRFKNIKIISAREFLEIVK